MLAPVIELLLTVIDIYKWVVIAWIVLSWLISFQIVNVRQPFVWRVNDVLSRLVDPVLRPIRRVMPDLGGVDLSPLVLFLALQFIQSALVHWIYAPLM